MPTSCRRRYPALPIVDSSRQFPPGLVLDPRAPAGISGTPTTAGTFIFTVAVTDKAKTQTTELGTITVNP